MSTVYLILALVVAIIAVIFALQNTAVVTISFFAWTITGSLSLVLLVTLAIGVLIGLLVIAPSLIKNSIRVSGHRKRSATLEKEAGDQKATIERLQAKVEQLLAERVTPTAISTPSVPPASSFPGDGGQKPEKPV
jgi:lipopolysaccharide assembly protein A